MQTCAVLTEVELACGDPVAARRAFERAGVWGRPTEDDALEQAVFDATDALLAAETGDLMSAVVIARRIAAIPVETSGHGMISRAWLLAGEVLARAGAIGRGPAMLHQHAQAPQWTVPSRPRPRPCRCRRHIAAERTAPHRRRSERRGVHHVGVPRLATPQWLVAVRPGAAPPNESGLTEDEAVALALQFVDT